MNKNKDIEKLKKNITDEEKQKYKEHQKNYRKNMSDKQKQRYRKLKINMINIKNIKKIIEKT